MPGSVQYTEIVKLERRRRIAVMRAANASGGNVGGTKQLFERSKLLFFKVGAQSQAWQTACRICASVTRVHKPSLALVAWTKLCCIVAPRQLILTVGCNVLTQPPGTRQSPRAGRWPAQGKCTPLRFTWKDNAVNVGKLMRYELVKELQDAGPDVEVECTGDPTELTELNIKDEVRPTDEPALPGLQAGSRPSPKPHTGLPASLQAGRRCRARL